MTTLTCGCHNIPVRESKVRRISSICLQCRRPGFDPWVRKIPWRRKWQPTPVPSPGKSHGQRSLVGCSPWGQKESDPTERLHFHYHFCWIAWFTRSNSCLVFSVSTWGLFKPGSPCRIWNSCVKEWLGIPKDGHNQFISPNHFWKSFKVFKESVRIYMFCGLVVFLCNIYPK